MNNLAVGSLLDPANVGRYVWCSWNGNKPGLCKIVKVTRTNVHVENGWARPVSMRVNPDRPGTASGNANGYQVSCATDEARREADERRLLTAEIRGARWGSIPIDVVRDVHALIESHL
jgi:hypothetical protein